MFTTDKLFPRVVDAVVNCSVDHYLGVRGNVIETSDPGTYAKENGYGLIVYVPEDLKTVTGSLRVKNLSREAIAFHAMVAGWRANPREIHDVKTGIKTAAV